MSDFRLQRLREAIVEGDDGSFAVAFMKLIYGPRPFTRELDRLLTEATAVGVARGWMRDSAGLLLHDGIGDEGAAEDMLALADAPLFPVVDFTVVEAFLEELRGATPEARPAVIERALVAISPDPDALALFRGVVAEEGL